MRGWCMTFLDSQVRVGEALESAKVDTIKAGSLVYVAEVRGRRAHIQRPVEGWMSVRTADGVKILRLDTTYQADADPEGIRAALRSQKVRDATERLKESQTKLTAVRAKLLDSLKLLKQVPKDVEDKMYRRFPELAQRAHADGTHLSKSAAVALKKEHAEELLHHVGSRAKRLDEAARRSRLMALMERAKHDAKEAHQGPHSLAVVLKVPT